VRCRASIWTCEGGEDDGERPGEDSRSSELEVLRFPIDGRFGTSNGDESIKSDADKAAERDLARDGPLKDGVGPRVGVPGFESDSRKRLIGEDGDWDRMARGFEGVRLRFLRGLLSPDGCH
jgi:hypothetical protein